MDCIIHGIAKQTRLSDFHFTGTSQVALVVKNPPTNAGNIRDASLTPGPGRSPWRREWQPTPIFLSGEYHGQRSLEGYSPWDHRVRHD